MATPEFILSLREKIGHDPLWLIGTAAYVEDDAGRLLLGQRADTGEWSLVCGINEPAEEPADTVVREVREETGVDVVPTDLVSVKAEERVLVYANRDQCQYLNLLFCCKPAKGGNVAPRVNDDESLAVGWFAPNELPQPLSADTQRRIKLVRAYRAACEKGEGRAFFSCTEAVEQ